MNSVSQAVERRGCKRALEATEIRWLMAALIVLIGIAGVAFWQLQQRGRAADLVRHALMVHAQVEHVTEDLLDAEASSKAYVLTGNQDFIADYDSAMRRLPRDIGLLRQSVADDPRQDFLAGELAARTQEWVLLYDKTVQIMRDNGIPAVVDFIKTTNQKPVMDSVRDVLLAMDAEEGTNVWLQQKQYERRVWLTNIALGALLAFSAAIVVSALLLVRRHSRLREEAEAQLAERQQRLHLALEAAEAGAWDLDVPRRCLRCHDLCARILDFGDRSELLLDNFLAKVHPEDAAEVSGKFAHMLANPSEGFYQDSFRIVLSDGSIRWIHMRAAPYLSRDEPRIVGIAMNVTRGREAQRQIRDLLAQTQELLAQKETLIHEIDHRVKNSLQLAASTLSVQARLEKDNRIRRGLKQAEQRLHAMAQVHKIIQESEDVGEVSFGIQMEKLAAEFAQLSESTVEIECHGDRVLLPARKAVSLAVIVNELLMNILKHTTSQRRVHVAMEWHLHDTQLVLTVRDDGPGMPEDASESGDGFGRRMILGLVKQLKGSLKVHSDRTGTCYEITVPLPHG